MAKRRFGTDTTVVPRLGDDGRVYFAHLAKPISERLLEWTVPALWFLAAVVGATALWI